VSRSQGANTFLHFKEETVYGTKPTGNWHKLPFFKSDMGAEQPLIQNNLLGQGREPQDSNLDVVTNEGGFGIPADVRNLGYWLKMLMGAPTTVQVAATGTILFPAQPLANDTITINGTVFTYVAASPTTFQILIGADLSATLANTTTKLNGSADVNVTPATYSDDTVDTLIITHDTLGSAGNAFTLAADAATVSGATLTGGGYRHTFKSGSATLPSFSAEIAHINVPNYRVNVGGVLDTMQFTFARSGTPEIQVGAIARNEETFATSQAGTPDSKTLTLLNQFNGQIKLDGAQATVTGGGFTYANTLEKVDNIEPLGLIAAADPTQIKINGNIDVRFKDTVLLDKAAAGTPVALEYNYTKLLHERVVWTFPRVILPKPKVSVDGPVGVQVSFGWEAAFDSASAISGKCELYNDVASYPA